MQTAYGRSHTGHAIMPFAATRMDLEIITLSEESQTKTYMISFLC